MKKSINIAVSDPMAVIVLEPRPYDPESDNILTKRSCPLKKHDYIVRRSL